MTPNVQDLYLTCENTWPPAATKEVGGFTLRNGEGGGKRVSAATLNNRDGIDQIILAEIAMIEMDQTPLFMIRDGDAELDGVLEAKGYEIIDPVNIYCAEVDALATERPPRVSMFNIWEPLQIQLDIWAQGGIGPNRIRVMDRAKGHKTSIISRWDDHPAGTAYVAIHDNIAMVHALEILPHQRKKGVGTWFMRQAAFWAKDQGATHLSVICTQHNIGANALYTSLGMELVGQYHYRLKK